MRQSKTRSGWALGVFAGVIGLASLAPAATLLQVDFNSDNDVTQAGFTGWKVSSGGETGPLSRTFGSTTVTLAQGLTKDGNGNLSGTAPLITRDRNSPSDATGYPYARLLRDWVNVNGNTMGIEFAGLTPNTTYAATFYAYDSNKTHTQTFTDITPGSTGASGSVSYSTASPYTFTSSSPLDAFAVTLQATTDSQGRLFFSEVCTNGSPDSNAVLDGFELATVAAAVPEPASLGLLLPAAALLLRRRA